MSAEAYSYSQYKRSKLRWMEYVELGLRNMGRKDGEQEIWTEQNRRLSFGKAKVKFEGI
jgi:hypothetical protein